MSDTIQVQPPQPPPRPDYTSLLTGRFLNVPAWRDFAQAVGEVIDRNVDNPRRLMGNVRDTVKYRKDQFVSDLTYTSGPVVDINDNPLSVPVGSSIPTARIVEVMLNQDSNDFTTQDYMVVEFTLNGGNTYYWTMPISAPQERSLLVQSAHMLGFDFFNTDFTDKEYVRITEFISKYWPYSGTTQFIDFMAFIKNIKLEGIPLWSYDDGTDNFPVLEALPAGAIPASKGGTWYLTSHVELQFDPIADIVLKNTTVLESQSYQGLEDLFYFFAPINLVLERIVAAIALNTQFFVATSGQELLLYQAKVDYTIINYGGSTEPFLYSLCYFEEIETAKTEYEWPILSGNITANGILQFQIEEFGYYNYDTPEIMINHTVSVVAFITSMEESKSAYQWPVLSSTVTGGATISYSEFVVANWDYTVPSLDWTMVNLYAAIDEEIHYQKYSFSVALDQLLNFEIETIAGVIITANYFSYDFGTWQNPNTLDGVSYPNGRLYPELKLNSINIDPILSYTTNYYGNHNIIQTDLSFDLVSVPFVSISTMYYSKITVN